MHVCLRDVVGSFAKGINLCRFICSDLEMFKINTKIWELLTEDWGCLIFGDKAMLLSPQPFQTFSDVGESSSIMCSNNIGVIHHSMGKPNMACHYFQQALKEDIALTFPNKKENGWLSRMKAFKSI